MDIIDVSVRRMLRIECKIWNEKGPLSGSSDSKRYELPLEGRVEVARAVDIKRLDWM